MKNRAALVALIVLAIATLLMIFVILPRLSSDKQDLGQLAGKATDAIRQATEKTGEAAPQGVAQLKEKATATLEKMNRLSATSTEAATALTGLFDAGRLPGKEEFAAARAKAEAALNDLSVVELPEGIGGEVLAKAQKLRDDAGKALAWLKALPADPAAAAAVIGQIRQFLPLPLKPEARVTAKTDAPRAPTAADSAPVPLTALPTFDVLRVEPDGSTVIAGRAAPGVTIEIVSGETVLTKATTGPNGEFAAILDNPLPPGDHQLALRATGADGSVALSGEVATVSVPKDKDGQLLAMISTPGQASRLLTIPAVQGADKPAGTATASNDATPATPPASTTAEPATPGTAAPATATATPSPTAEAAAVAPVRVTAVEIEGDRIFVAGSAKAGTKVRGFAGNVLIGEVTVDPSGHFVIDGAVPLTPGDHIIAVEMLDEAGHVAMKVSVPFNRPEGNQVSAVAGDASADAAPQPLETPDTRALARLQGDVGKAFELLKSLFANGAKPGKEQLAAARSAVEIALKSLTEFVPVTQAPDAVKTEIARATAAAGRALTTLNAVPGDAEALGKALDGIGGEIATVTASPAAPATTGPQALSQAPLTPSDSAVIIRRGDTLWQISRRVYGQGVRYTTIYLANRGEINNPDLIEPGQVFTVPRDALPNAEELHRKRLSGERLQ